MRTRGLGRVTRQCVGADTTRETSATSDAAPKGERARELLAFVRAEVQRTGVFPDSAAMMAAMGWKSAASVDDALLRLIAGGFATREVAARKGMRRTFAYRLAAEDKQPFLTATERQFR